MTDGKGMQSKVAAYLVFVHIRNFELWQLQNKYSRRNLIDYYTQSLKIVLGKYAVEKKHDVCV